MAPAREIDKFAPSANDLCCRGADPQLNLDNFYLIIFLVSFADKREYKPSKCEVSNKIEAIFGQFRFQKGSDSPL